MYQPCLESTLVTIALLAHVVKKNVNEKDKFVPWGLFTDYGQRKYLTRNEVDLFIESSNKFPDDVKVFCHIMAYSGCRISEALSLTVDSIDFQSQNLVIKCLKKRGKRIFRAVPLPPECLRLLGRWLAKRHGSSEKLWDWSRMTAYRRICEVMGKANIRGAYATPKGLRHAFGIRAIQAGVPLTLVQKWLGHADIKTTAIYTSATGAEEREIALKMWRRKAPGGAGNRQQQTLTQAEEVLHDRPLSPSRS